MRIEQEFAVTRNKPERGITGEFYYNEYLLNFYRSVNSLFENVSIYPIALTKCS